MTYSITNIYTLTPPGEQYVNCLKLYENKIVSVYDCNKYGSYIRDPVTREHIGVVTIPGTVDLSTDSIGTMYLDIRKNEPFISKEYYLRNGVYIVDGIYPHSNYIGSVKSSDLVYARYDN